MKRKEEPGYALKVGDSFWMAQHSYQVTWADEDGMYLRIWDQFTGEHFKTSRIEVNRQLLKEA